MKKRLLIAMTILVTGCASISERIEIPPEQQAKAAAFQYPVLAKADEVVVYVVNKNMPPLKWDRGLVFSTEFELKGAGQAVVTQPGEYAVMTVKPGTYEPWASRICHGEKGTIAPAEGSVMKVREPGWVTFRQSYGRKFAEGDRRFEFKAGTTYVFSLNVNCAMVVAAGGVMFYPRIQEVDEAGGKYLLMNSKPARN